MHQLIELQPRVCRTATEEDTTEARPAEATTSEAVSSQTKTTRQSKDLTGGEWLARAEAETKRRNITRGKDKRKNDQLWCLHRCELKEPPACASEG